MIASVRTEPRQTHEQWVVVNPSTSTPQEQKEVNASSMQRTASLGLRWLMFDIRNDAHFYLHKGC